MMRMIITIAEAAVLVATTAVEALLASWVISGTNNYVFINTQNLEVYYAFMDWYIDKQKRSIQVFKI